jgi:hypothetical protein
MKLGKAIGKWEKMLILLPNTPLCDPASVRVSMAYRPSGDYPFTYQDRYLVTLDNGSVHIDRFQVDLFLRRIMVILQ